MKKPALFVLVLIFVLLVVSCKQDISYRLNIPSWVQGRYSLLGTINIKGADPRSLTGYLTFSHNNITGSFTISGVTTPYDYNANAEGMKDYMTDFSQLSSSHAFSYSVTTKKDGVTRKIIAEITDDGLTKTYSEFDYVDGSLNGTIEATLSPM